jgi:hypothetical protein
VEYCGLAAKRAMNLSKYGLTEKQCSGQLSTPRVGSEWRRLHKRPSTVTAEIRGHQIPRVLWFADSSLCVSLVRVPGESGRQIDRFGKSAVLQVDNQ